MDKAKEILKKIFRIILILILFAPSVLFVGTLIFMILLMKFDGGHPDIDLLQYLLLRTFYIPIILYLIIHVLDKKNII